MDPIDIGELWFVVAIDFNDSLTSLKKIYFKKSFRKTTKKPFENLFFPKQGRSKILFDLDPIDIGELWFVVAIDFNDSLTSLKKIYFKKTFRKTTKKPFENLSFFRSKLRQKIFLTWIPLV